MENNVVLSARKAMKGWATAGNILIVVTVLAMIVANTPIIKDYYAALWELPVKLQIGDFNLFSHGEEHEAMTFMQFINDALMAIFFFTIGLEIKREVLVGELSSFRKALLPIIAACGGMIVPIIIFWIFSTGTDFHRGSAIPMATDIAFSLGVLSMLGSRVPISLKIFLTTLAVADDLGGILVIAFCYSSGLNWLMLLYALGILILMFMGGSVFHIRSKIYYIFLGIAVWFLFLNSGIHPTIAGVIVAFTIPANPVFPPKRFIETMRDNIKKFPADKDSDLEEATLLSKDQINWLKYIESASDKIMSPLQDLEDSLHPIVNYLIIPLFAFANAGIVFEGMEPSAVYSGVSMAVICGLFFGKFIGIFTFSWLTIKSKLAPMPTYCNWKMMASVAIVGGIGFTVSLFIATLSFPLSGPDAARHIELLNNAKMGIIVGSVLSGFVGYFALKHTLPKSNVEGEKDAFDC